MHVSREAKVLACLDADHEIGLGHAVRTRALLAALGRPARIAVAGDGAQLDTFFPGAVRFPLGADPGRLAAVIAQYQPDLIVADLARPGARWWDTLQAAAPRVPLAVIDDFGADAEADLVINGTVLEHYHRYPRLRPGGQVRAGAAYALLRPEFAAHPWREHGARGVTIVVGSGDAAADWAWWLVSGALDVSSWGSVRMIVGATFPDREGLAGACAARGVVLASGLSGEQMAQLLAQSSVVLVTGGMVVYEALATGVPAVVYPQMDNMKAEIAWLARAGCVTDLGHDGGLDAHRVGPAVAALLDAQEQRAAMSAAQRAVTDGRGVHKAAQAIAALLDREAA